MLSMFSSVRAAEPSTPPANAACGTQWRAQLMRNPVWHETTDEDRIRFLQRIAITGTRVLNRQLEITFDDINIKRC
jgi:hypothetical protein